MDGFRPGAGGRLILWHGEPGTGKTSAIRAWARAWKSWCSIEFITDPDAFFGKSGYMMSVLLGDGDDEDEKWRLLVLETPASCSCRTRRRAKGSACRGS